MAKILLGQILLGRVAGFNRDQLLDRSIVKFLDFRGRNSPFRANPWEFLITRASFLVSHLPMPYPNVTKQKSPHVYPLSTPVEGVDGEV